MLAEASTSIAVLMNYPVTGSGLSFSYPGALHLPEQHYFTHSQYSHLDQYRDKSARDYEHPIKFESRILKDTTTSMHRLFTIHISCLPHQSVDICGL